MILLLVYHALSYLPSYYQSSFWECIGSKKQYAQAMTMLKKRGYNQVRGMLFLNRRHEILNEDGVEKVYDAVLYFLEQHSQKDD